MPPRWGKALSQSRHCECARGRRGRDPGDGLPRRGNRLGPPGSASRTLIKSRRPRADANLDIEPGGSRDRGRSWERPASASSRGKGPGRRRERGARQGRGPWPARPTPEALRPPGSGDCHIVSSGQAHEIRNGGKPSHRRGTRARVAAPEREPSSKPTLRSGSRFRGDEPCPPPSPSGVVTAGEEKEGEGNAPPSHPSRPGGTARYGAFNEAVSWLNGTEPRHRTSGGKRARTSRALPPGRAETPPWSAVTLNRAPGGPARFSKVFQRGECGGALPRSFGGLGLADKANPPSLAGMSPPASPVRRGDRGRRRATPRPVPKSVPLGGEPA